MFNTAFHSPPFHDRLFHLTVLTDPSFYLIPTDTCQHVRAPLTLKVGVAQRTSHNNMSASDGEEESEELALFRQQWRQELGIAQPTPGTGRGGQYLTADIRLA